MTIQELFKAVDVQSSIDNPFETQEELHLINSVINLFSKFGEDNELIDDYADKVYDLIDYERQRAFTVGYQTAISLIFSGVTVE